MMRNRFSQVSILAVSILLVLSCSSPEITKTKEEKFQADKNLALIEAEKLHRLVREENFDEIYLNASFCIKEYYSLEKFKEAMLEAVEKLQSVDSDLKIWAFEKLDSPFPSAFHLVKGFGIGDSAFNPNYVFKNVDLESRRFAMLMTYWQNEDGAMKLTGYQVLMGGNRPCKFYGTSSCITTDKTEMKNGKKIIMKARIVINSSEVRHIEKTVFN